ncbi:hypothetical protein [Paludibacterium purpuratum]|uniref:Uncharacterized protein n=1 Tax=Paludibacterium purpuratum TaxID=1144873 RepID=A0A4R7B7J4_9NEIS|nr:hypothetical protein [Paludibacterium purpuratum]TDR79686.1 hypothetical protein DFP86_10750 [Paludibacterium purpuratum]
MKTRIFAAILAIFSAGIPLLASADDSVATSSSQTQAGNGMAPPDNQRAQGNEVSGDKWEMDRSHGSK